jgi:hypothetical protein
VTRTPIGHLLVVWVLAIALFAFGPIHYKDPPQLSAWLFVVACLVVFCIGAWLGLAGFGRALERTAQAGSDAHRVELIVRATAIVGLLGAGFIAVDKVLLSGLDFSQGVTAVRFLREEAVAAGTAVALPRSPLLYLGYLTFSFSVASYLLYLLKGEGLRLSTAWLAFASLASPFAYSYLYGGRSPLFLVLGMACGAIAVRRLSHQTALPRGKTAPLLFVAFVALIFVYSSWILSERFAATGANDYSTLQARFETSYDATISSTLCGPLSDPSAANTRAACEQALMHATLNTYYFSHELPMLDRTLAAQPPIGPYYGAYQFYLASAFVERVLPSISADAIMIPQLKAANVYGWFSSAWGGMYLDFGVVGALLGVLLCGWLSGRVYRSALVDGTPGGRLLMCYVVAGILATPILSIFTISISLPILVSLAITAALLDPPRFWRVRLKLARGATAHTT